MSCSRRKPLDASAMSAVRWGVTLQDSGVEMSSVLPAEQASHPLCPPSWLGFYGPSTNKYLFSPLIRTQSLRAVCFKIKFCFGVNCQLLCFRGCLPACVEELATSPVLG